MRRSHHPQALSLRRRHVQFDNIALVPASALPFKDEWQTIANALPRGDALLLVPEADSPMRRSLVSVAEQLRRRGHRVAAVGAKRFSRPH